MKVIVLLTLLLVLLLNVSSVLAFSLQDEEAVYQRANLILPDAKIQDKGSKECFVTNLGTIFCTKHEIMQDLNQCVRSTIGGEVLCIDKCGGRSKPGQICTPE